jgi:biopolymer transport protein ExbB
MASASPPSEPAAQTDDVSASAEKGLIMQGNTLWEIFQKGGVFMYVILATSICGSVFAMERLIELRRKKHAPADFEKDIVHLADIRGVEAALAACLEKPSSLSRVLYAGFRRQATGLREMEAAMQEEGTRLQYDLRRNCRVVGVMSNVAPLLGLLGTCTGLMWCFEHVAAIQSTNKFKGLSEGVATALLTTAFGLIVAIPLYLLYHFIRGRADDLVGEIESRAIAAAVEFEGRARKSIRLIDDLNENLETKEMQAAASSGELDASAFESSDQERAIKTGIATPPTLPAVAEPKQKKDGATAVEPPTARYDDNRQAGGGKS